MTRVPKSLTFTIELWEKIDSDRGEIPRSRFVEKIIRRSLGDLN
jgi:hypothetical protein